MNQASYSNRLIHGVTATKQHNRDARERKLAYIIRQRYISKVNYQQHTKL